MGANDPKQWLSDSDKLKILEDLQIEYRNKYTIVENYMETNKSIHTSEYMEKMKEERELGDKVEALWWAVMAIKTYQKMIRTGKSWDKCYPYRLK
jgi:hypothetical protein